MNLHSHQSVSSGLRVIECSLPDAYITVWVKTWAEVINDARARLGFVNKQLAYEADRDSAKSYLRKTHAKFIPDADEKVEDKESDNK